MSVTAGTLLPLGECVMLTQAQSCEVLSNLPVTQGLLLTSSSSQDGALVLAAPPVRKFMAEADNFHSPVIGKKKKKKVVI